MPHLFWACPGQASLDVLPWPITISGVLVRRFTRKNNEKPLVMRNFCWCLARFPHDWLQTFSWKAFLGLERSSGISSLVQAEIMLVRGRLPICR